MLTLINQGAEAKIFLLVPTDPNDYKNIECSEDITCKQKLKMNKFPLEPIIKNIPLIKKHRIVKSWRHPTLDYRLRKSRHKQEINCIIKALDAGLPVPCVLAQDPNEMVIWSEYIEGRTLKDHLNSKSTSTSNSMRLVFLSS